MGLGHAGSGNGEKDEGGPEKGDDEQGPFVGGRERGAAALTSRSTGQDDDGRGRGDGGLEVLAGRQPKKRRKGGRG